MFFAFSSMARNLASAPMDSPPSPPTSPPISIANSLLVGTMPAKGMLLLFQKPSWHPM